MKAEPITITLSMGPLDGETREVEARDPVLSIPAIHKGLSVLHRYALLTHRRSAAVIRYLYVETVVDDPSLARPSR